VIILTVYSEEQYAVRALKREPPDFSQGERSEKLIDAVRKVVQGGRFITAEWRKNWLSRWWGGDGRARGVDRSGISDLENDWVG